MKANIVRPTNIHEAREILVNLVTWADNEENETYRRYANGDYIHLTSKEREFLLSSTEVVLAALQQALQSLDYFGTQRGEVS